MEKIIFDTKAQVSAELLLLISAIMLIVLLAMHLYQQYLDGITNQIHDNELNDLLDKIDSINEYV